MDPTDSIPQKQDGKVEIISDEVSHVNREMYLKNLELAERNKTLSLLRKIDAVILSKVTDIQQIAQQVTNIVVDETEYIKLIIILLFDQKKNILYTLATSQTESVRRAELEVNNAFHTITLPLAEESNIIVTSVKEKRMKRTNHLADLLPSITPDEAKTIQEIIGNTSLLIYPLIAREEIIGAIILGIDEKEKPLSFYQIDLIDRLPGIVAISIDNGLLYKGLQTANDQLTQLDKMKDEFVSLASHELKTPLTAIKSYLWLVLNQNFHKIQDKRELYIERSYTATERLIKMVNNMLNISRIESGRLTINLQKIDLIDLLKDAITELTSTAQRQNVQIIFQPSFNTLLVLADPEKTRGVIINLIGNAIKFTPANGAITVSITQKNELVEIAIKDTGRGINQDDLGKLFQKFEMIGKDVLKRQDTQEGTGLGLYISKSIIELMGGRIWAQSEGENKGSTFYFTLKLNPDPKPIVDYAAAGISR